MMLCFDTSKKKMCQVVMTNNLLKFMHNTEFKY